MSDEVNAEYIKNVRTKYGLTQKAFAKVLGIGEASIIRYEQGSKPTKAMANLIRAANNPEFMADCLKRDGQMLGQEQKQKAESVVYAMMTFNEKGEVMDINEMYEVTLAQEILNEKAALILADVSRALDEANEADDTVRALICRDVLYQISVAKSTIVWKENSNLIKLAELRGRIDGLAALAMQSISNAA